MEIDSALTAIQTLRSELQDAKLAAANTQLKPLPGESVRDVSDPRFIQRSVNLFKKNKTKNADIWQDAPYARNAIFQTLIS